METNLGYQFKKINEFFVCTNGSKGMALSTPQKPGFPIHSLAKFIEGKEVADVKDYELKKLWHHRVRSCRKILDGNTVSYLIKKELTKRGYCLGVDKKWINQQNVEAI